MQKLIETHKRLGRGKLMCNASDATLAQEFNRTYGEENYLDGVAWDDRYIYIVTCYDGKNGIDNVPRNPEEGRLL